ncbi:DUF4129 domain-containing transglutaminase family protein [Paenibacillus sp. HW567]|uniref:DUF4129 domain-containing transglutaminase family protein n=1 Tax=Paenibacillus sp. HW567 TaxID=1034769 RepID=UPI00036FA51C|nr:transglutaminase domain-containing protein [Paenibacillus sp. HW567]
MIRWWNGIKSSWHHSFGLLWLMVIALQWVSYTEPFWLEETTSAVLLTLAVAAVIEILLPVKLIYRLLLEAAAAVYLTYRMVLHYGGYVPNPWLQTLRDRVQEMLSNMTPYIWFALGALVLLLLSSWWVTSKPRILMFIGMNIAAFAALDSFTTSILWREVAWTVFAGMGWLVTQHLRSFQLHYPRGWTYLLKYPLKVAVNVAIIFSLVIITGVNMPEVRPTLTDPYTAWQEWKGGGGGGTASGTSGVADSGTSTTSSGGTTSGYSTDDNNLGGGFNFDYSPIMTVNSDMRTYMRGETRSMYSGSGWIDDDTIKRGPFVGAQVGQLLEQKVASKVETRELKISVKLLGNNSYPVLFGGYSISTVNSINGEAAGSGLFWRSEGSELLWNTAYPREYVLTSQVPVVPVDELNKMTYEQLYGREEIDDQYLQLPQKFPERVRALAQEVTSQGKTPYEKISLLQQYLQQTFPYTNQPDLSRRKSKDFVESFLFEVMEGYCDYYSTALVTMARSLDIPARWVKGYAPGEQAELPDNIAMQQGAAMLNNNYTITNADAHSWAEVYFGEYGWIPVEATPGFNTPLLTQSQETTPENAAVPEEETKPEQADVNKGTQEQGFHMGAWIVAAASAVLLSWLGFLLWHYRMSLRFILARLRYGQPLSPVQKVEAETARWVRYARRKGMLKEEHETLRESVDRWRQERPASAGNLSALLEMFERAKYSPEVVEDKDWRSVYTEALRLRQSIKSGK